ncbi:MULTISPECIES: isochorismatase family protein [unclassified Pseudonocardia]|jgi:nicotinamidase-related amidase|uniref:isochorismatase family protein n=1 Tax=unclassified Pseudonocardia TaxID=2619320 RepID=UPI0009677297|nr:MULTISPECIES: isochorismatase family protein [unclassified Pseudonocardia]OLM17519.1 Isochorismatase [Pseudonocardia sp. Ae707_Ps1]
MTADDAVLLLVDLQERLAPAIHDGDEVVARAARLAEGAGLLGVPVLATEQVPDKLGPTVGQLSGYPHLVTPKSRFAADGSGLLPPGRSEIVVTGMEAHVCVLQTVLQLLADGRRVLVAADATGSRDPRDKSVALDRARAAGAEVVTSEMVLFEWLRDATHPRFREVQKLLK